MTKSISSIENVGPHFSLKSFFEARGLAWKMIQDLSVLAKPGMKASDFLKTLEDESFFPQREKWWHPIKVRLGKNTQCSFRDKDFEDYTLKEGDLFFFDIGPVFFGHEADVGQTFKLGDPKFKNPAKTLFDELESLWSEKGYTGEELYQFATERANSLDLEFNPKMVGHRLSDFPHAIHHKGPLGKHVSTPLPDRWILEVHLVDPKNECGYFYEDLLRSE